MSYGQKTETFRTKPTRGWTCIRGRGRTRATENRCTVPDELVRGQMFTVGGHYMCARVPRRVMRPRTITTRNGPSLSRAGYRNPAPWTDFRHDKGRRQEEKIQLEHNGSSVAATASGERNANNNRKHSVLMMLTGDRASGSGAKIINENRSRAGGPNGL